jgi:hypothetical protein
MADEDDAEAMSFGYRIADTGCRRGFCSGGHWEK